MTLEQAQWALNAVGGLVIGGMSWWMNTMWAEIKELRKARHEQQGEIAKLQILVVGDYVRQETFNKSIQAVTDAVNRGFDKIDSKMDDIYDELKHKMDKP